MIGTCVGRLSVYCSLDCRAASRAALELRKRLAANEHVSQPLQHHPLAASATLASPHANVRDYACAAIVGALRDLEDTRTESVQAIEAQYDYNGACYIQMPHTHW